MTSGGPQDPYATRPYPDQTRTYPDQQTGYAPGPSAPGAPGYGQGGPGYGQGGPGPYGYPGYAYPVRQSTNTLAILALVFAFVCAPAAIVMGALARGQIRRTGEEGMGLATAGLVIGIVFTVIGVIWIIAAITVFAGAVHDFNQQNGDAGAAAFLGARALLGIF